MSYVVIFESRDWVAFGHPKTQSSSNNHTKFKFSLHRKHNACLLEGQNGFTFFLTNNRSAGTDTRQNYCVWIHFRAIHSVLISLWPDWEGNKLHSPHFMELGSSLPHSQQPTTCPNPSSKQSIPLPITLLTDADCFLPGRATDLSAPRNGQNRLYKETAEKVSWNKILYLFEVCTSSGA